MSNQEENEIMAEPIIRMSKLKPKEITWTKPTKKPMTNNFIEEFTKWYDSYEDKPHKSALMGYFTRKLKQAKEEGRKEERDNLSSIIKVAYNNGKSELLKELKERIEKKQLIPCDPDCAFCEVLNIINEYNK